MMRVRSLSGGAGPVVLQQGSRCDAVVVLQDALKAGGFMAASEKSDGIFGAKTAAALRAAQQTLGFTVNAQIVVPSDLWMMLTGGASASTTPWPTGGTATIPGNEVTGAFLTDATGDIRIGSFSISKRNLAIAAGVAALIGIGGMLLTRKSD